MGDVDLLHPPKELEQRRHKLKRLVQSPNSFFMDVKCPGCFNITTVHACPVRRPEGKTARERPSFLRPRRRRTPAHATPRCFHISALLPRRTEGLCPIPLPNSSPP